jgi:hypothetical protein
LSVQVSGCVCFVKNVCLNVLGTSVGHGKRVKQNLRERDRDKDRERQSVCTKAIGEYHGNETKKSLSELVVG